MKTRVFTVCVVVFLFCGITHAGLSDGLVAYYPFNGNANDESGNGHSGTVHGAALASDRFGNANSAYRFNGVDNEIRIGNPFPDNMPNSSNLTIVAWIKTNTTKASASIVSQHAACLGTYKHNYAIGLYGISTQPWPQLALVASFFSQEPSLSISSSSIIDNSWHQIVAIYNGSYSTLYVDGIMKESLAVSPKTDFEANKDVVIGGVHANACPENANFEGNIDDVRIYNRALLDCEVKELYTGQTCTPDCYTQGYTDGYAAGDTARLAKCQAYPTACGIDVNSELIILTPDLKMHLPNLQYTTLFETLSLWADLAYESSLTDAVYFKVTGVGLKQ
jgi:hypothetical protein